MKAIKLTFAFLIWLALPAVAVAADAVRGKALFFNTNGAPQSCGSVDCHNGFPAVQPKGIAKGSNPTATLNAIANNKGGMGFLSAYVNAVDAADIAAYIANPTAGNGTPAIALSATSATFAAQIVGTTSAPQTVTVSNGGTAALTLTSLTLSGGASADFARAGTCTAGGSVAAGSSCSITLTFTPSASGTRTATLTILHNAAGGGSTVALSGTGSPTPGAASVSPASLAFTQIVNSASLPQTVTIANTGGQPLTIGPLSIAGASAAEYSFASGSTCAAGTVVNGGANCILRVIFTPTATGVRNATLSIAHTAAAAPATVSLNGTGTLTAQPAISLSATELDFGTQSVGNSSAANTVTVTNSGQAPLTFGALTLSGSAGGDFRRAGSCASGATVTAGATCTIELTLAPTAVGTRAAVLTIASNAANGTATVSLSGAAVQYAIMVSPTSGTLQAKVGALSEPMQALVSNPGASPLTVSSIAASERFVLQPGSNGCGTGPIVLSPSQSCNLYVAFQPTDTGTVSGEVTIASQATATPSVIALSAQATSEPTSAAIGSASNIGLGGCSIGASEQLIDPTLALMLALAVVALRQRRR
jgi:hypothetical protein